MDIFRPHLRSFLLLALALAAVVLIGCSESEAPESIQQASEKHLINGENYIKQGQYKAAMLEVRNAVKKAPSAKTVGVLAELYMELGQYRAAQALLENAIEKYPALNFTLVDAYTRLGKYHSAQDTLKTVNKADVDPIEYALFEAKILVGTGEREKGNELLKNLSAQYPEDRRVQLTNYLAIYRSGTPEQAEKALQALIAKYPKDPEVLFTSAKVRFLQKNYDATEELLMNALHESQQTDVLTPLRSGILNLLSKTLTQQGRYADALPFEKLLKEANPDMDDIQSRLETAFNTLKSGDIKEGEELLEKLREEFPNINTADALLGLVSLEKGEVSKASDLFSKSVDPETAAPNLSAAAAIAALRLDEKQKALGILEQAVRTSPDSLQLQSMFGVVAISTPGKEAQGAAALEKAIELGTSSYNAYGLLAMYYGQNDKTKAEAVINKAKATFSEPDDQLKIFGSYLRLGMTDKAEQYAADLRSKDDKNEAGWLMAAATDIQANAFDKANSALNKAVQINPKNEKSWYLTGTNALNLSDWTRASQAFKKAISLNTEDDKYLQGLYAAESQQNKNWAQKESAILSIAKDDTHKARILAFLTQRALFEKKFDEADALIGMFRSLPESQSAEVGFLETQAALSRAAVSNREGDHDSAISTLENALTRNPESIELLVRVGNIYLQKNDIGNAEKVLGRITDAGDKTMAALFEADILDKKGQVDEAFALLNYNWEASRENRIANAIFVLSSKHRKPLTPKFLTDWQKADPQNPTPLLAHAMKVQGEDSDKAIELYKEALRLDGRNVAALNNLAWLYQQKNKLDDADKLASFAASLAPRNASVLDTAGYIKMRKGEKKSAIALLERAVELAPDEKEIKEHLLQAKNL